MANINLAALFVLISIILNVSANNFDVKNLIPGKVYESTNRGNERLSVYCYKGVPKHLLHFWQTVRVHLTIEWNAWETYHGRSTEEVLQEYEARRSFWSFNLPFSRKHDSFSLDPFNLSCIGVKAATNYSIYVHIIRIDFWRAILFFGGVFIFLTAKKLSAHPLFYYTCGITLGVSTSFLIFIYLLSKLIPKKPALYGFLTGGWAISAYLVQLLFTNLRTVAQVYQNYVLAYFSISSIISFAVCYRYGPVSNPRTLSLIKWALQSAGLAAMFFSSQFPEASMAAVLILVGYQIFPRSLITASKQLWIAKFPPKRRLLTEEEYHEQGARETVKALEELRQYCSSPECNQWKTVLRLSRPVRFAQFIEGESHLSDAELLDYESDITKPNAFETDDESDE